MTTSEKVRENRMRRIAARRGMTLIKSRTREPGAWDHGGYLLMHGRNVELGVQFSASLADVERYFKVKR